MKINSGQLLLSILESVKTKVEKFDLIRQIFSDMVVESCCKEFLTYRDEFGEFQLPDTIAQWKQLITFKIDLLRSQDLDRYHIDRTIRLLLRYFKIHLPEIYFDINDVFVFEIDGSTISEMQITTARNVRHVGFTEDDSWIFSDKRISMMIRENCIDIIFQDPRPYKRSNYDMMRLFKRSLLYLERRFHTKLRLAEKSNLLLQKSIFEATAQRKKELKQISENIKFLLRALEIEIGHNRLDRSAGKTFIRRVKLKKIDLTDYFTAINRSTNFNDPKFQKDLIDLVKKSELKRQSRMDVIKAIKSGQLDIIQLLKDKKLNEKYLTKAEIELIKQKKD